MQKHKDALAEAIANMAAGTTRAANLKDSAMSAEVRELAAAVHFIGFGAQQIALAFLDRPREDWGE